MAHSPPQPWPSTVVGECPRGSSFPHTAPQEVTVSQKSVLECRGGKVTWEHFVVSVNDMAGRCWPCGAQGHQHLGQMERWPPASFLQTVIIVDHAWVSGFRLQRWERRSPCGFKPPGLWSLVTATPGNAYG